LVQLPATNVGQDLESPKSSKVSWESPSIAPNARAFFALNLVESTPVEKAGIEDSNEEVQESPSEARRSRRRTKLEIKQEIVDEIMDGFRQLHPRLVQLSEVGRASKEADIRHWCIDVLKSVLGYNDEEIASEANILGQYADIVLKAEVTLAMLFRPAGVGIFLGQFVGLL
jgi:hypothetical protein